MFKAVTVGISDSHNVSCSADFDEDGWTDMVVGQSHNRFIYYYRNRTFENPAPDWSNSSAIRTPKFTLTTTIETALATGGAEHAGMVCADYDGDGHQDFFYYKAASETAAPNIQRLYRGKGNGTFHAPYAPLVVPSQLPYYGQTSTNAVAYDYNGDGWLDILYGGKKTSANDQRLRGGAAQQLRHAARGRHRLRVEPRSSPSRTSSSGRTSAPRGSTR